MSRLITSNAFVIALQEAGVLREGERYRKIAIVAEAGQALKIYSERFADEDLLKVIMTLDGIEVRGVPSP